MLGSFYLVVVLVYYCRWFGSMLLAIVLHWNLPQLGNPPPCRWISNNDLNS